MPTDLERELLRRARLAAQTAKDAVASARSYPSRPYPSQTAFPHPVCHESEEKYDAVFRHARMRSGTLLFGENGVVLGKLVRRVVKGLRLWDYSAKENRKMWMIAKNPKRVGKRDAGFSLGEATVLIPHREHGEVRLYLGVKTRRQAQVIRPVTGDFQEPFLQAIVNLLKMIGR